MEAGDLVRDRYRLDRWIAAGGMGSVWEAHDLALDQTVALKRVSFAGLPPDEAEQSRARTLREARTAARLRFVSQVIATLDVIEEEGDVWLVQEYLASRSLADVLSGNRRIPLDEVARIGAVVARALDAAARAGVVHRDVKPGNVLIAETSGIVKITDFGISHAEGESRLTRTNAVSGTPAYMAREVAIGEEATAASDVYSLGSTLYRAAEGVAPFGEDDNLHRLLYRVGSGLFRPPEASGPLTPLFLSMLDSVPSHRPTAAQVAESLDDLSAQLRIRQATTAVGVRTPAALRTVTTRGPLDGASRSPGSPQLGPPSVRTGASPYGPPHRRPEPTIVPSPDRAGRVDEPQQTNRRALLLGGVITAAVIIAVGLGVLVAGANPKTVPEADLESQVVTQLTAKGVTIDRNAATCPQDLEAETGNAITCTFASRGIGYDAEVRVTSVRGDTVNFDISASASS